MLFDNRELWRFVAKRTLVMLIVAVAGAFGCVAFVRCCSDDQPPPTRRCLRALTTIQVSSNAAPVTRCVLWEERTCWPGKAPDDGRLYFQNGGWVCSPWGLWV